MKPLSRTNAIVIVSLLLIGPGASIVQAQYTSLREDQREAAVVAARTGLRTFAALVNSKNFQAMGFDSAEQVQSATLGTPSQEFMIRLDELQRYKPGTDVSTLLHPTGRVTFPVVVGDRARSSMVVQLAEQRWQVVSYGAPRYIGMLTRVRERLAAQDRRPATDYFEVRAPALNVVLLGQMDRGRIMLTPVLDDPRLGLKSGERMPSERVMETLAAAAREHNGLPS